MLASLIAVSEAARLLGELLVQVERDARLDVDERQLMAERVVQLPGDPQSLLARSPEPLLFAHPGRLGDALPPDADDQPGAEDDEEPGGEADEVGDRGRRLGPGRT